MKEGLLYNKDKKSLNIPYYYPYNKKVYAYGLELEELTIDTFIEYLDCSNNNLTKIFIPFGCYNFDCSDNLLDELYIGKDFNTLF